MTSVPIYLSGQEVVGVGDVHAGRGHLVELLARCCHRLRDVDDVQDLGTAEAGDLNGTLAGQATAAYGDARGIVGPPRATSVDGARM